MRRRAFLVCAPVLLATLLVGTSQATVMIDDFSPTAASNQAVITTILVPAFPPNGSNSSGSDPGNIIAGTGNAVRVMTAHLNSGSSLTADAGLTTPGSFTFNPGSNGNGSATLQYYGAAPNMTPAPAFNPSGLGAGGVNLAPTTETGIDLQGVHTDFSATQLSLTLYDPTHSGGVTVVGPLSGAVNNADVFFTFASFAGIDPTQITAIVLGISTIGTANANGLTMTSIVSEAQPPGAIFVTPEPASLVVWSLLGMCSAGLCWWRKSQGAEGVVTHAMLQS